MAPAHLATSPSPPVIPHFPAQVLLHIALQGQSIACAIHPATWKTVPGVMLLAAVSCDALWDLWTGMHMLPRKKPPNARVSQTRLCQLYNLASRQIHHSAMMKDECEALQYPICTTGSATGCGWQIMSKAHAGQALQSLVSHTQGLSPM